MDSFNKKLCLVDWTGLYNTDYFVNVHQKHTAAKHRAFSVFIFNTKKELLLKKLALDNPLYPGLIENSCRSHPAINDLSFTDPMADCAKQAVKYMESEFGIVVDDKDLKWVDLVKYHSTQANTTFESMDLSIPDNDVDNEILNKDLGDAPKVFCQDSFVDYEKTYIFYIVKDFVIKPNLSSYSEAFYVDSKKMQTLVNESNCSP